MPPMEEQIPDTGFTVVASFIAFLAAFIFIGALSVLRSRHSSTDYLIASHSIKPWLTALSAVATNNSGYMFVGLIGFTYAQGLSAAWLMIGWIFGDMLISFLVHRRLREMTETRGVLSYGGLLSKWNDTDYAALRLFAGIMTVLFLGTYAAAQLSAGSKALHVLFGWDYSAGAIIGAVIVLIYCFAGGIRASIWTDAAQSFVMFFAMIVMTWAAVGAAGGPGAMLGALNEVGPHYMDVFPHDLALGPCFGPLLFVLGWFVAGIGVIGQPHVMVRFMSMDDPKAMTRVRIYYYSWYIVFSALCVCAGLAARVLLDVDAENFDAELALPTLALELLPDVLVGLVLAGLFAATMSTADSQILSCSAAVTRDVFNDRFTGYWLTKGATLAVALIALLIALFGADSVFVLIVLAWAALASAFAPLLIVYAFGFRPAQTLALAMAGAGFAAMLAWHFLSPLSGDIYAVLPGMAAAFAVFFAGYVPALRRHSFLHTPPDRLHPHD